MQCDACGAEMALGDSFCPQCGRSAEPETVPPPPALEAAPVPPPVVTGPPTGGILGDEEAGDRGMSGGSKALLVASNLCLGPAAGIALYLAWKEEKPRSASQVCTLTWAPYVLAALFWISFYFVLFLAGLVDPR